MPLASQHPLVAALINMGYDPSELNISMFRDILSGLGPDLQIPEMQRAMTQIPMMTPGAFQGITEGAELAEELPEIVAQEVALSAALGPLASSRKLGKVAGVADDVDWGRVAGELEEIARKYAPKPPWWQRILDPWSTGRPVSGMARSVIGGLGDVWSQMIRYGRQLEEEE